MKSEKIINAYNKIELSGAAETRIFNIAMQKQNKKRPVSKAASVLAAIIFLVIVGGLIFSPFGTNQFSMKCYAMDTQNGQPPMRPIDGGPDNGGGMIANDFWYGYIDIQGDTACIYVDVGWKIEGENIKRVELTVEDGYFVNKLGRYDFEEIGNRVLLDEEDIHKGDMLYFGCERPVSYVEKEITYTGEDASTGETWEGTRTDIVPEYEKVDKIVIHAVVTFKNGKTEEKDMILAMNEGEQALYENMENVRRMAEFPFE